ncbi:MAG: replication-relaxation family protein [Verrucomicrobiota bacterium]
MNSSGKRKPRFRRVPGEVEPMALTSRDREIIRSVARLRFARSTHLIRLVPGAKTQLLRRLRLLYHHGWLDRPRCQLDYFHRGGTTPMVYCLGSRGAELLRGESGAAPAGMAGKGSGAGAGRIFLDHTLAVTEVLVNVEMACRESAGEMLYVPPEALAGASGKPLRWNVALHGARAVLIPDAVFGLEFPDVPEGRQLVVCCLEADRGTMPVTRKSFHASSILSKLHCYSALWRRGEFEKRFGSGRLLVMMVTSGPQRCANIRRAVGTLPSGRGIFACWTQAEVSANAPELIRRAAGRGREPGKAS